MIAVDHLSERSLRELMALARERLGRDARALKTRAELLDALRALEHPPEARAPAPAPAAAPPPPPEPVVTRDFFIARAQETRRAGSPE